jgi:predicted RNA binding protein YcfA (HicA-like mRNA interferase family)
MSKQEWMEIKKTSEFIKEIGKIGYTESKKNGSSHRIFKANNRPMLSIPNNREMAPGTKRNLVKLIIGEM